MWWWNFFTFWWSWGTTLSIIVSILPFVWNLSAFVIGWCREKAKQHREKSAPTGGIDPIPIEFDAFAAPFVDEPRPQSRCASIRWELVKWLMLFTAIYCVQMFGQELHEHYHTVRMGHREELVKLRTEN